MSWCLIHSAPLAVLFAAYPLLPSAPGWSSASPEVLGGLVRLSRLSQASSAQPLQFSSLRVAMNCATELRRLASLLDHLASAEDGHGAVIGPSLSSSF